jgi:hypothetical protein
MWLNAFGVKASKTLPGLITTHLPGKVKLYLKKMEYTFETYSKSANPQLKQSIITYLYRAFLYKKPVPSKYSISTTFLSDTDAFYSVKKGLETYMLGMITTM